MQGYQAGTTGETDYTAQTAEDQRKAKVVASKSLYPLAALADTFIGRNTNAISKGVSWLANAAGVPRMVRALGGTLPDDGVKLPVIGNGGVSPFSEGAVANAERFAPTAVTPQVPKTAPAVTTAAPTPLAHMPEVGGSSELSPALRALISADAQKEGIPNPVANFKGTKGGAWRISTEPEPAKVVPQVPVRGVTPINFGVLPAETPVPTTAAAIKPVRFTEEKMSSLLRDLAPKAASIVAAAAEVPPEDKRSFIEKGMGSLFGEQGVFRPEDAVRLAVLFGAGVATGGSVNGSLKYAGLDALKHMDAREASETTARATAAKELRAAKQARLSKEEEREYNERNWRFQQEYKRLADAGVKDQELAEWEYKQRVEEANRGKTAAAKTNFDVLSKRIDETFENQAITPRIRRELQNRLLNGDHVTVASFLDRPEVIENEMQMVGNVAPGTKPVLMTPIGQEDRVETFKNRDGNLVSRNKAGKWVITNPTGWQEAPATQRTPDESAKAGAEMFDKRLFEKDGDKPPALDQKAATAQLGDFLRKEWSRGHPVAGPALVSSLNIMMEKAKRSGEKDINVSKLLDMLTIHPASLADEEKLLLKGSKDKQVPVHYFGSMYDRIKKVVTNDADNFMSDISLNYDKSKDYYKVDDLDPSNPYSIAIKESPNNWWAYVNRKLYDKQLKK